MECSDLLQTDCLILAAGTSSRMCGENKLLKEFNSRPLICHTLDLISLFNKVYIVVGFEADKLVSVIKNHPLYTSSKVEIIKNNNYIEGQLSSFFCGINAIEDRDFFVVPADLPFLSKNDFLTVYSVFTKNTDVVRPMYNNIPVHPVLFNKTFKNVLLRNKDNIESVGKFLKANETVYNIKTVQLSQKAVIDLDTPNAWMTLNYLL